MDLHKLHKLADVHIRSPNCSFKLNADYLQNEVYWAELLDYRILKNNKWLFILFEVLDLFNTMHCIDRRTLQRYEKT